MKGNFENENFTDFIKSNFKILCQSLVGDDKVDFIRFL